MSPVLPSHAIIRPAHGPAIACAVRQSRRAKRWSVVVHWDRRVEVIVPARASVSVHDLRQFLENRVSWIQRAIQRMKRRGPRTRLSHPGRSVSQITARTEHLVSDLMKRLGAGGRFPVRALRVRRYRSRWGSCSPSNTIGVHYKLCLLPPPLCRYVVIHELCHTIHHNHSSRFWHAVAEVCPSYLADRRALRNFLP